MANPIVGNITNAKAKQNSLPKFNWLIIAVVIDAIPICIKPMIEATAPAFVEKFSRAIGVSNGTVNDTPINVSDSMKVKAIESSIPVNFLKI